MIPYIVVLVFLLVMTLYLVYKQGEGFEAATTEYVGLEIKGNTTIKEILTNAENKLAALQELKKKAASRMFKVKDSMKTAENAGAVGWTYTKILNPRTGKYDETTTGADGKSLEDTVKQRIDNEIKQTETEITNIKTDIDAGRLRPNQTLRSVLIAKAPAPLSPADKEIQVNQQIMFLNSFARAAESSLFMALKQLLADVKPELEPAPTADATAVSSASMVSTVPPKAAPTSVIALATGENAPKEEPIFDDVTTIFAAVPADKELKNQKEEKLKPEEIDDKESEKSMKELEKRLSKTLATQVRQELMKARAMDNVRPSIAPGCSAPSSESTYQGYEFQAAKSPLNMNDYIRKDSIPCWNCTLPA